MELEPRTRFGTTFGSVGSMILTASKRIVRIIKSMLISLSLATSIQHKMSSDAQTFLISRAEICTNQFTPLDHFDNSFYDQPQRCNEVIFLTKLSIVETGPVSDDRCIARDIFE